MQGRSGRPTQVTITERLYHPLSSELKARFDTRGYSDQLNIELHRTPRLVANLWAANPHAVLLAAKLVGKPHAPSTADWTLAWRNRQSQCALAPAS